MSVDNQEILRKAVITTDSMTTAGLLNPEQADKFIDFVWDICKLKGNARTLKFRPEELQIDKIGVGSRAAVPKVEATDPGVRRGITTSRVTLRPSEVMVPFEISYTALDVNLEGEKLAEHLVKMFATQFGNDLEELYIQGDQLGAAILESDYFDGGASDKYVKDGFLALQDGWLTLARQGHGVDFAGANISNRLFSRLLNALPEKFKRDRTKLRFFCSTDLEQNYREKVAARATGKGDQALMSEMPLTPFGVPLIGVPLLPFQPKIVEHVVVNTDGTTATALLYKDLANVVVTTSTLGASPESAYTEGVDYTLDAANGTITRLGGGSIPSGGTVKVTYQAEAQVICTHQDNFLVGIGKDVRIETDRDIFKSVLQYALTAKVACEFEEADAISFGYNIGLDV